MNWDEGSYTLSHTYERFLTTSYHKCDMMWQEPEEELNNFF